MSRTLKSILKSSICLSLCLLPTLISAHSQYSSNDENMDNRRGARRDQGSSYERSDDGGGDQDEMLAIMGNENRRQYAPQPQPRRYQSSGYEQWGGTPSYGNWSGDHDHHHYYENSWGGKPGYSQSYGSSWGGQPGYGHHGGYNQSYGGSWGGQPGYGYQGGYNQSYGGSWGGQPGYGHHGGYDQSYGGSWGGQPGYGEGYNYNYNYNNRRGYHTGELANPSAAYPGYSVGG
jgi:hypothetical protein